MEAQAVRDVLRRYPDLRMSYEEFLGLGAGVHGDWIDGRVRLQERAETERHSKVLRFTSSLMQVYAESRHGGEVLILFQMRPRSDLPSREVDLLYLGPDCRARLRDHFVDGPADLVVEVVSDESRRRDREQKLREYEWGGVRECWLIDTVLEQADLYRLDAGGRYRQAASGRHAVLRSEAVPGMWFRAEWFWDRTMPRMMDVTQQWGLA
ncbi:MAG TPA: Uma2 family endonuclease [Longimicrobium sp.]|nr:Uma2 family endonuclease [Longimicrobium sp.]